MHLPISENAWGGPDLLNPDDPNGDIVFDWYEFTFVQGRIPFGGNTTQVDQFGFPMTVTLRQDAIGYDETVGIRLSRAQVFDRYAAGVSPDFAPLRGAARILAPRSAAIFKPGGNRAAYLQPHIDAVWSHFAANPFHLTRLAVTFTGQVVGGRLQFNRMPAGPDGSGPFFLDKPGTADVFECAGPLARSGMRTSELEMGAELCAAFNRGVARDPASWYTPSAYYPSGPRNDFSMIFHQIGVDGRAYGFAYDDVNDQSTVKILPNANPPTALTITLMPQTGTVGVTFPAAPKKETAGRDFRIGRRYFPGIAGRDGARIFDLIGRARPFYPANSGNKAQRSASPGS
jgi:hypothetical protein